MWSWRRQWLTAALASLVVVAAAAAALVSGSRSTTFADLVREGASAQVPLLRDERFELVRVEGDCVGVDAGEDGCRAVFVFHREVGARQDIARVCLSEQATTPCQEVVDSWGVQVNAETRAVITADHVIDPDDVYVIGLGAELPDGTQVGRL